MDSLVEGVKKTKEKAKNLLNETKNDEYININNKNYDNKNYDKNNENNYIIAEIYIKEVDINKDIRILNSYEECLRTGKGWYKDEKFRNEDEIKECEIKINDELIPFNYFYEFKSRGKFIIKYSFKDKLKSTCLMFQGCSSLTNINLSNFDSNNVTIMNGMFYRCSSLKNVDLSNFNTKNVINMALMFYGCSTITNINLSNFITNMVTNINGMFSGCSSLTNINLSNFNATNVTNMSGVFYGCKSLKKYNIITKDSKILNLFK